MNLMLSELKGSNFVNHLELHVLCTSRNGWDYLKKLMRRLATCINNRIEFPWAARKKKNLNWNEIKMYQTSHYSLACLDNRAGQNCWAEKIWQKKKTDDLDLLGSTAYPTHYVTTRRCRCSGMSLLALKCSNCIRLLEIKVRIYIRVENHSKISDIKHVWFDVKSFHCCSSKEIRTFKVTNDDTFAQSNCWNYNDQHSAQENSLANLKVLCVVCTMCSNIDMILFST